MTCMSWSKLLTAPALTENLLYSATLFFFLDYAIQHEGSQFPDGDQAHAPCRQ